MRGDTGYAYLPNRIDKTSKTVSMDELDQKYRQYCESREGRKGYEQEEYATDREFAEHEVGDFLDWLEEVLTGKRPQPDTVVHYYRRLRRI